MKFGTNQKKNILQYSSKQPQSINKVYESQSKSLTKSSMGSVGMKYKESVQSNGSNNNNTYNLRVPGSGTKMSSHVTVQAASVSGISGDINVNLMKMFDNSQKKKQEPEDSDSDSDRMD